MTRSILKTTLSKPHTDGQAYLFMKVINGVVHIVRVFDAGSIAKAPGDGLEVRTAFRPKKGLDYVKNYVERHGLH